MKTILNRQMWAGNVSMLVALLISATLAMAEEGGSGHYLPGTFATLIDNGPTRPGWVGLASYTYYSGEAQRSREFPIAGTRTRSLNAETHAGVASVMYTIKPRVLGAHYSVAAAVPVVSLTVEGALTGPIISPQRKDSVTSLGDVSVIPAYLAWTNGNFQFNGLLNIITPTGDYEVGRLANTGLNYWTFNPVIGVSYFHPERGFGGTVFSGVTLNTENSATDYHSGSVVHVDGSLYQFLPFFGLGNIGIGANGFYYQQISGDSGAGAVLGGFEGRTVGVGPILSWLYENAHGTTFLAEAKWLPELDTKRRLKGDLVWFKFAILF